MRGQLYKTAQDCLEVQAHPGLPPTCSESFSRYIRSFSTAPTKSANSAAAGNRASREAVSGIGLMQLWPPSIRGQARLVGSPPYHHARRLGAVHAPSSPYHHIQATQAKRASTQPRSPPRDCAAAVRLCPQVGSRHSSMSSASMQPRRWNLSYCKAWICRQLLDVGPLNAGWSHTARARVLLDCVCTSAPAAPQPC